MLNIKHNKLYWDYDFTKIIITHLLYDIYSKTLQRNLYSTYLKKSNTMYFLNHQKNNFIILLFYIIIIIIKF